MSATRDIVTTTRRIADAIRATPGVAVIGRKSFFFSVFFSRSMTFFYICVSSYDKVSDVVES